MKIYLYALLLAIVPYVNPMVSSSSNQHSDTCIIIKNNTNYNLWFSINAGGAFTKIIEGSYERITPGIPVFWGNLLPGMSRKTVNFTNGLFLTAKIAKKENLLCLVHALLAVVFNPEKLKDIAMVSLDYNEKNGFFFSVKKQHTFCYLCMKMFKKNDQPCMLRPCGHCFHLGCYNTIQDERGYLLVDEKRETCMSQHCPGCEVFIDSYEMTKILE